MKVYVSELPKSCQKCPCESDRWCNLMGYVVDEDEYDDKRPIQCPLQSLSDYTKQVRKEVIEQIKGIADIDDWEEINGYTLKKILYQIQGESNVKD